MSPCFLGKTQCNQHLALVTLMLTKFVFIFNSCIRYISHFFLALVSENTIGISNVISSFTSEQGLITEIEHIWFESSTYIKVIKKPKLHLLLAEPNSSHLSL